MVTLRAEICHVAFSCLPKRFCTAYHQLAISLENAAELVTLKLLKQF